jgi:DNA repair protein RecO (recombination protein O)
MSTERATALVIRGTDWSETSRIITLFTREFGQIRGLAKGGRRIRSSFEVSFDLLSVCRIVFIRKAQGGLDLIIEAQLAEQFPILRTDLQALYAGYYLAELLTDGTAVYDPHVSLYDTAIATLRAVANPAISRPAAVSVFELAWLRELGYSPRLEECAVCNGALPDGRIAFSPSGGGLVCAACSSSQPDRRWLSAEGRAWLKTLHAGVPELPSAVRGELRPLLAHTVSSVLGRRPKMLAYVDVVS